MATAGPSSSQEKVRDSHSKVSIEEKLKLATEFKVTAVFLAIAQLQVRKFNFRQRICRTREMGITRTRNTRRQLASTTGQSSTWRFELAANLNVWWIELAIAVNHPAGHWQRSPRNPGLSPGCLRWPQPQEAHWPGGGEDVHRVEHLHLQQPRRLSPPDRRLKGRTNQGSDRGGHWAWPLQWEGLVQARMD